MLICMFGYGRSHNTPPDRVDKLSYSFDIFHFNTMGLFTITFLQLSLSKQGVCLLRLEMITPIKQNMADKLLHNSIDSQYK